MICVHWMLYLNRCELKAALQLANQKCKNLNKFSPFLLFCLPHHGMALVKLLFTFLTTRMRGVNGHRRTGTMTAVQCGPRDHPMHRVVV